METKVVRKIENLSYEMKCDLATSLNSKTETVDQRINAMNEMASKLYKKVK